MLARTIHWGMLKLGNADWSVSKAEMMWQLRVMVFIHGVLMNRDHDDHEGRVDRAIPIAIHA